MNSDEDLLYDPHAVDEEQHLTTPVAAAFVAARASTHDDGIDRNSITESESIASTSSLSVIVKEPSKLRFLLEPAVFIFSFGAFLSQTVFTNQILYSTCIVVFDFNATACEPLLGVKKTTTETQELENIVQPYAAKILMIKILIESIVPALVSLFIGPWSDKYGRRPIILTTFAGAFLSALVLLILCIVSTNVPLSPWFFLFTSLPTVLTGGTCVLITGIYCYVSDLAVDNARAKRMVILDATLGAGMGFGAVLGGYLYTATNTVTIFSISAVLLLISFLYVLFFVNESLKPAQVKGGSKLRAFFDIELIKDLMHTTFKYRQNFGQVIIWLTMLCLIFTNFSSKGDDSVSYLFMRKQFGWSVEDFSTFHAIAIGAGIVGCTSGIILLLKIFKTTTITMTIVCLVSAFLQSMIRGFAKNWWEMYIGLGVGTIAGVSLPMMRAMLSIFTCGNEVGKIFALTTSLQYLTALGAAPLYTAIYDATLLYYPGTYNFISAGSAFVCLAFTITIFVLKIYVDRREMRSTN